MSAYEIKLLAVLIATILIVGLAVSYFLWSMVRQYRLQLQLSRQFEIAKIEAQESERQLIAADLHDDIGPILSATNYKLGEIVPDSERGHQLLREATGHVDQIFLRIRTMSSKLVPRSLYRKGALYAFEEFTKQYMQDISLKVEVTPMEFPMLTQKQSLHLFRMLQEILHNAVKHSGGSRFVVSAEPGERKLVIKTEDNGKGFRHSTTGEPLGFGLQNLELRAELIGAELVTDTSPGAGTRYIINIPINQNP